MRKVTAVKTFDSYLECEMENGDIYKYDMSYIHVELAEMTKPLMDKDFFKNAYIELGSVAWPNGYDIHADSIVRDGELIKKEAS